MPNPALAQVRSAAKAPQPPSATPDPHETGADGNPPRGLRRNGRARSQPWPVPLTTMAELLYLDIASPYRAAKRFGLRNWLTAQVRAFLTQGAAYCVELDLERSIRFNAAYLTRRAAFVLERRRVHRGGAAALDGCKLAEVLGLQGTGAGTGFLTVWLRFIDNIADDLVEVSKSGHIEDVRWADAERYIDRAVAPRPRNLRQAGATPAALVRRDFMPEPLSCRGGYRRMKRILDALTSPDPLLVAATLRSWECARVVIPSVCGDEDWDAEFDEMGR